MNSSKNDKFIIVFMFFASEKKDGMGSKNVEQLDVEYQG